MGIIGGVVKLMVRFYKGFEDFADKGFRYIDAPWFSDYQNRPDSLDLREGRKISA